MHALKHSEQFAGVFHIEACSVIANKEHCLAVQRLLAHFNSGGGAWTCELDRIRQ
jgi:hypothetical protein